MSINLGKVRTQAQLATALDELRRERRLSFFRLAHQAGVANSTAEAACKGGSLPRLGTLLALVSACGERDTEPWQRAYEAVVAQKKGQKISESAAAQAELMREKAEADARNARKLLRDAQVQWGRLQSRISSLARRTVVSQSHTPEDLYDSDIEMIDLALSDTDLMFSVGDFGIDLSPVRRRQLLVTKRAFLVVLRATSRGQIDIHETQSRLTILCRTIHFRDFWETARMERAMLQGDSVEAHVGRMVDDILQKMDEADVDEWWVVGEF